MPEEVSTQENTEAPQEPVVTQETDVSTQTEQVPSSENTTAVSNVFDLSEQGVDEAKDNYNKEQAEAKEEATRAKYTPVDLTKGVFDEPNTQEGALSQNGRLKSFVQDCKSEIEYLRENSKTPDKYEFTANSEVEKGEFGLDTSSPLYTNFAKMAKENGMSQNQFNEVANLYLSSLNDQSQELNNESKEHAESVISALGKTPIEGMMQIRSLSSQITELNVPKDQQLALQEAIGNDADAIKAVQHIMKSIGYKNIDVQHTPRNLQAEYDAVKESMLSSEYTSNPNYKSNVISKLRNISSEATKFGVDLKLS